MMKFVCNKKAMQNISDIIHHLQPTKTRLWGKQDYIELLNYDSRKIRSGRNSLFFALKGDRDGHKFIAEAYNKGVRNFILSDPGFAVEEFSEANFIWVEDSLAALQQIALQHRLNFSYPIIAITGSNGKTIVKQWLYELLQSKKKVYQSPKSYNSQIGVALSLWNLSGQYDLALIEAGISKRAEMERLEDMIRPNWGIFTSLGTAHREGFASEEQKLEEKWKLFCRCEKILVPSAQLPQEYLMDERVVSWGQREQDALQVRSYSKHDQYTRVTLQGYGQSFDMDIPFSDKASIDNALTCALTLLEMGYSFQQIAQGVATLKALDMRLHLKKGKNNSSIIDDSYSNDLASLNIALDFLNQQHQYAKKKLVLSEFEGESWDAEFQNSLKKILASVSLDEIIFVGDKFQVFSLNSKVAVRRFSSTGELLGSIGTLDFSDAIVLIKGARSFKLEKLSKALSEKSHETVLQINLKALEHNLKVYRSKLSPSVKLMAMVKAFSYGSGSFEVANILQFNNVDYLTVAFADEGSELRRAGVNLPIMVLSPHQSAFDDIIAYSLEPEIYSLRILKAFIDFLSLKDIHHYPIHLKLDTGMHRLGFMPEDLQELIQLLQSTDRVRVSSVFSHLAAAGDASLKAFTAEQIALYTSMSQQIKQATHTDFLRHICNTSGIIHHQDAHMDMVRLGIGLYGVDMSAQNLGLQEVGVLKTTITQIKKIPKDQTIGYDRKGVLSRDSIIATVKIGYADGYNRKFGNGVGQMSINGTLVSTVGSICMDMCMLDITDIQAEEGDEVIVFPDVKQAAKDIDTIPYELLTGISSRVKRIYYYE